MSFWYSEKSTRRRSSSGSDIFIVAELDFEFGALLDEDGNGGGRAVDVVVDAFLAGGGGKALEGPFVGGWCVVV